MITPGHFHRVIHEDLSGGGHAKRRDSLGSVGARSGYTSSVDIYDLRVHACARVL